MKIKGKSVKALEKAYSRLKEKDPVKAGYIKNYLFKVSSKRKRRIAIP